MATVQGYNQVVAKTTTPTTPTINVSSAGGGSKPVDFTQFNKGLGDVANMLNKIHEEQDKQAIVAAMDNYNQSMNEMLVGDKGLLNTKMEESSGIVDSFAEQQQKLRASVVGGTKLHFAANTAALDHYLNNAAESSFQKVRKHQEQQMQAVTDTHYNNLNTANVGDAAELFNNPQALDGVINKQLMLTDLTYGSRGKDFVDATNQKAVGSIVSSALQSALANNDYSSAQNIFDKYRDYIPASQRINYEKLSYSKQENNWLRNTAESMLAQYGSVEQAIDAVKNLSTREVVGFNGGASSVVDKVRDLQGKIPFRAKDGTNCVRTLGIALKGTPYEGLINTVPMIEIARKNKQLIPYSEEAARNAKPGDTFIGDGGDGDEIGHAVMKTDKGTIQNGASRNGVYEKEIPPEQMLNSVKWIIRTSDYNDNKSGNRQEAITEEQKEQLINMIIAKRNKQVQMHNMDVAAFGRDMEQKIYQASRDNMSAEDAYKQFVDKGMYADNDHYEAALHAYKKWYGVKASKNGGAGSSGGAKADSGVSAKTVYQVHQLIAQNEFGTDSLKLQTYLDRLEDMGQLTAKDNVKCRELFDDYTQGKGAFKINWSDFDAQTLELAGLKSSSSAAEKERITVQARAAALQFMKKEWQPNHAGQTEPTTDEILAAIKPKLQKQTWFTYIDPKWYNSNNGEKFSVSEAQLNSAGIKKIQDLNDTQAIVYFANGSTEIIPKRQILKMFGM